MLLLLLLLAIIMQNPQITNGMPVAMENEVFVLSRAGIHFTAKSGRVKAEGSGNLFLSTLRMVFVADKGHHFDMPLATMHDEKFNQPIFGANNMTGQSPPLDLEPGAEDYKWCISFRNGGVGTFLPFFFRLLEEMRRRMQQAATPVVQVRPLAGCRRDSAYHFLCPGTSALAAPTHAEDS